MIPIKNVYHMLSYAFHVLNDQGYKKVEFEEFENFLELGASIIAKGVTTQVKRGLAKGYITKSERSSSLKGKISLSESIKSNAFMTRQLVCVYDDFSENIYFNRILKTTMSWLLRSNLSKGRKKEIRKLIIFFSSVEEINVYEINWDLQFNRNNQNYRMLVSMCYLVLHGMIQKSSDGTRRMIDFIDEKRMARLYEKFILEYYKKEFPKLKVAASQIPWNCDDGFNLMLPTMQSDIMISNGEKTLIIDAKYYASTTQTHYASNHRHTIHSQNLYQIFTYVKNQDAENTGNVSGMLLYAKTDETIQPNQEYRLGGNPISVKVLDLNCEFEEIKVQLNQFVQGLV